MKFKPKKDSGKNLSDKIAEALTVKSRPDIEDDHVFGTKPKTVSRVDFSSSESDDEAAISDFRKRNVNLLSDISKKYEGQVVSRKEQKSDSEVESDESDSDDDAAADIVAKLKSLNGSKSAKDNTEESSDEENQSKSMYNKLKHESDSDNVSDEEDESDDYSINQKHIDSDSGDEDEEGDEEEDEDDDEGEGYDISQMDEPPKEEFEHVKKQNISEEAKKGNAVRNQLLLWEGLLEMRIHLQRCLNTANQMPIGETVEALKQHNEFTEESNVTKLKLTNVLDKMLSLQNLLLKKNPEMKTLSLDKFQDGQKPEFKLPESDEEIPSDMDEEIPSDTEEEDNAEPVTTATISPKTPANTKKRKLDDYEKEISKSHKVFKSFRDSTIQKWNEKTRLATAANIKSAPTNTILQQISYILSDKEKLVKRTQLKRSEFDIIGYKKPVSEEVANDEELSAIKTRKDDDEYIPEIFDDSDFYHQLLRELIECKSADISDPVQLSRQWIALQQMRSKMKRKVDTKATKGRKIKYVVHNQLVNYMAPEKNTIWTEESANELYSSLFGKMFENNNAGVVNVENGFKIMK